MMVTDRYAHGVPDKTKETNMRHGYLSVLALSAVCLSLAGCQPKPTISFIEAIEQGNLAEMKACMAHSMFDTADGPVNKLGQMPLHVAAEFDQAEAAEYLVSRGADVNTVGIWEWEDGTPLHVAVTKGNIRVARVLLAHEARTDIPDKAGRTVANLAATSGNAEMQNLIANPPSQAKGKGK